jgi:hypothetical protein
MSIGFQQRRERANVLSAFAADVANGSVPVRYVCFNIKADMSNACDPTNPYRSGHGRNVTFALSV